MEGPSVKVELQDGPIKTLHVNVPRRVPYAQEDASKELLDKL